MKFGTFRGVFVPSVNAILGTVIFLILPKLTADVGFLYISIIIILAYSIIVSTVFSLSECVTNLNNVETGGIYFFAKKSLGKSLGGSIGIHLFLSQSFANAFYCIGFVEPIFPIVYSFIKELPLFSNLDYMVIKHIFTSIVFTFFFIITLIGIDFNIKVQILILFILSISVISLLILPLFKLKFNGEEIISNIINIKGNREISSAIFFVSFTMFFPGVTGLVAGIGMSGELKDPKKSLVKGLFIAVLFTFILYISLSFGYSLIRKELIIIEYKDNIPVSNLLPDILNINKKFPQNIFGIFIFIGILVATSSSVLGTFMTAPRVLQALSKDNILPKFLSFLQNDFFKNSNEPRFATIITYLIGIIIIWIKNIDITSMIVGISFLSLFSWINFSAFLEIFSNNPSFRPTFKGNIFISFYGFLITLLIIFLFNWKIGIILFLIQFIIFRLILKYKSENKLEGVWWGVIFNITNKALLNLKKIVQGTKNWRPILACIYYYDKNSDPRKVEFIVEKLIANNRGIANLNIISDSKIEERDGYILPVRFIESQDPNVSALTMIQSMNLNGIDFNTFFINYSTKLNNVQIINKCLELNKNIILFKNSEKLSNLNNIDIWWKGEQNGNLMVLLSYLISLNYRESKNIKLRIIRKLDEKEDKKDAQNQLLELLKKGRLNGEVLILYKKEIDYLNLLKETSGNADLIMMGLPGIYKQEGLIKIFDLNERFFHKEIEKYNELPPLVFVKSSQVISLFDEE